MLTVKPIIVFIMLLVPSLCDDWSDDYDTGPPPTNPPEPDFGSPEDFLKEVNEYRAKFAKERKIPNMYKLVWSNELVGQLNWNSDATRLKSGLSMFYIDSYRNPAEWINTEVGKLKNLVEIYDEHGIPEAPVELINPLQTFIGCSPSELPFGGSMLECLMGFIRLVDFRYVDPGEAGSQCPPRFKVEDGLCVPKDPSKFTFWGTEEGLLEDVNYMRRKYAKKFGIPNMHQLTWNDSLVEVLKSLDLKKDTIGVITSEYLSSSDSTWDGFGINWRITELMSFLASVPTINEAAHNKFVLNRITKKTVIRGREESTTPAEMIHPLQTSIGCMKKERQYGEKEILAACLLGNVGQWPSDWKIDANSTKVPGSECMDGYVNDDGLCVVAPSTTTPGPTEAHTSPKDKATEAVPAIPKKPDASDEKEKEGGSVGEDAEVEPGQEALESSTRIYSYWP